MTTDYTNLLQQLPAIEKLLNTQEMLDLQASYARDLVTEALRAVVADIRADILIGNTSEVENLDSEEMERIYAERTRQKIEAKIGGSMRPVVNATGTVIHTNLGRSLLNDTACEVIQQAVAKLCQPRIRHCNR